MCWCLRCRPGRSGVAPGIDQADLQVRDIPRGGLVHHGDRGVQYLSVRYTGRLPEAGIEPSGRSAGDSYANALAGTINGLFKADLIHRRPPWRSAETV
jgi:putative transposase